MRWPLAWVSPTYKGAGGTTGLVWASPPPTFHASGLQMEHMLGKRDGGEVLPGKAVQPPGSGHCVRPDSGGGWKAPSFKTLPVGAAPWHKGAFPSLWPLCPDPGSMGRIQTAGMSQLPSPLWGRCSSPLHVPNSKEGTGGLEGTSATRQQMGPVVGCSSRTSWRTPPGEGRRGGGSWVRPRSVLHGPSSGTWGQGLC